MDPLEKPLTEEELEDLFKITDDWYRHRWGSPMDPAMSRGLAKDVVRLIHQYRWLQTKVYQEPNTDKDFETNPCTICGAAPGVRCPLSARRVECRMSDKIKKFEG